MIFIDLSGFRPDDAWLYEAWQLTAELKSKVSTTEKNQFIEENREFWGRLKQTLPYNDKCWYSEAKESVSVYEIEHFRPTKATKRCKSILKTFKLFKEAQRIDWVKQNKFNGTGYWWLAFDFTNYRNCGKRVNGIKSVRFPLKERSFIAYKENDNYHLEEIILIDPLNATDPNLITFDPDGKARSSITDQNSFEYLRAVTSIDVYGLNAIGPLVTHRESKWSECYKAIRRAADKFVEAEVAALAGNAASFEKSFNEFMDFIDNDIKPAIDTSSEFSSVARACVVSYSSYTWINDYVLS